MGLMFLGISNINRFTDEPKMTYGKAEENYYSFIKSIKNIERLSSNENMLTNIDDMRKKFNRLIENGSLSEDDGYYSQMKSCIKQAEKYHLIPQKSNDNTIDFYFTYNNFNDMYKKISGDENV